MEQKSWTLVSSKRGLGTYSGLAPNNLNAVSWHPPRTSGRGANQISRPHLRQALELVVLLSPRPHRPSRLSPPVRSHLVNSPNTPPLPLATTEQPTCANTSRINSANKSQEADSVNSRRTTLYPYYNLVNPSQRGVSAHLPMSRGHFAIHVQAR